MSVCSSDLQDAKANWGNKNSFSHPCQMEIIPYFPQPSAAHHWRQTDSGYFNWSVWSWSMVPRLFTCNSQCTGFSKWFQTCLENQQTAALEILAVITESLVSGHYLGPLLAHHVPQPTQRGYDQLSCCRAPSVEPQPAGGHTTTIPTANLSEGRKWNLSSSIPQPSEGSSSSQWTAAHTLVMQKY